MYCSAAAAAAAAAVATSLAHHRCKSVDLCTGPICTLRVKEPLATQAKSPHLRMGARHQPAGVIEQGPGGSDGASNPGMEPSPSDEGPPVLIGGNAPAASDATSSLLAELEELMANLSVTGVAQQASSAPPGAPTTGATSAGNADEASEPVSKPAASEPQ